MCYFRNPHAKLQLRKLKIKWKLDVKISILGNLCIVFCLQPLYTLSRVCGDWSFTEIKIIQSYFDMQFVPIFYNFFKCIAICSENVRYIIFFKNVLVPFLWSIWVYWVKIIMVITEQRPLDRAG